MPLWHVTKSILSLSPSGMYSFKSLFSCELQWKLALIIIHHCNFTLESAFLFKSASVHFSEWCHKYKQNVKMAGQDAASQIIVININLFPTARLSYNFCIIKLSTGRNIEIGRMGGWRGWKRKRKREINIVETSGKMYFSSVCSAQ